VLAFEVGEVRNGEIRLDEFIAPLGRQAGFDCLGVVINLQTFTKTSNIWGVHNNAAAPTPTASSCFRKKIIGY
jgi:hypothetical protein